MIIYLELLFRKAKTTKIMGHRGLQISYLVSLPTSLKVDRPILTFAMLTNSAAK